MKLVFTAMIRASEHWIRVLVSELERKQLGLLRQELRIDPLPPGGQRVEVKADEKSEVA